MEGTTLAECPSDFVGEFTVPDGVTDIKWWAFADCSLLTSVYIPEGVTAIGDCAFRECIRLATVNIPSSVCRIGDSAFIGCRGLTSVRIPDSVSYIGRWAFENCSGLTSIQLPDGVREISGGTFSTCVNLASAIVPKACSVDADAFPDSCKIFNTVTEYRAHLVKALVAERNGVDVVGMHAPQPEPVIDRTGGRDI